MDFNKIKNLCSSNDTGKSYSKPHTGKKMKNIHLINNLDLVYTQNSKRSMTKIT
jgi:hypothetical protein